MPCALQPQYSLLDRGIETEVLPCALENGIGVTPWSPLGGGWLTGKYSADKTPVGATRLGEDPKRGVEAYSKRNNAHTHAILRALRGAAEQLGILPAHVALTWLANRPGVSSILLGARTCEQLTSNLHAFSLDTTEPKEMLERLTSISAPGLPEYPYGYVRNWSGVRHWEQFGT